MEIVVSRILQKHFNFLSDTHVENHVSNADHSVSAGKSKIVITLDKSSYKKQSSPFQSSCYIQCFKLVKIRLILIIPE